MISIKKGTIARIDDLWHVVFGVAINDKKDFIVLTLCEQNNVHHYNVNDFNDQYRFFQSQFDFIKYFEDEQEVSSDFLTTIIEVISGVHDERFKGAFYIEN